MMPPTSIDGTDITGATIDGTDVTEITVDGQTVFTAGADFDTTGAFVHYDATTLGLSDGNSVNNFPDLNGTNDLTPGVAPTYRSSEINGNPAVEFDGSDDFLTTTFPKLNQPITYFAVWKINSGGSSTSLSITDSNLASGGPFSSRESIGFVNPGGDYVLFAGSSEVGFSNVDGNAHVFTIVFDGSNSKIDRDGQTILSGNPGTGGLEGLVMGARSDFAREAPVSIGEYMVFNGDETSRQADAEAFLANKWGITI